MGRAKYLLDGADGVTHVQFQTEQQMITIMMIIIGGRIMSPTNTDI